MLGTLGGQAGVLSRGCPPLGRYRPRELQDKPGEADSLTGLARARRHQGRLADAAACFEQSLALCRRLGDPDREAKAMLFFAKVRRQQGRPADALALLARCRDIFRSVGSGGYAAYSDLVIGILRNERGEHEQAAGHLQQALAFAQTLGDPRWRAYVLLNLGVGPGHHLQPVGGVGNQRMVARKPGDLQPVHQRPHRPWPAPLAAQRRHFDK